MPCSLPGYLRPDWVHTVSKRLTSCEGVGCRICDAVRCACELPRGLCGAAGGRSSHLEYWIPAQDLPTFNAAIIGEIEVIAAFGAVEGA
jgi:hypothetical protein